MAERLIELRPHHLLCLAAFVGRGYSAAFVETFTELSRVYLDPSRSLRVVRGADDGCRSCPHREGGRCGLDDEAIAALDERVSSRLGLSRDVYTCGELHRLLLAALDAGPLFEICGDCRWSGLVDCESIIRRRLTGGGRQE